MPTIPAISLSREITYPLPLEHDARLYPQHRILLIGRTTVLVIQGTCIYKTLSFDDAVVTAVYTEFTTAPGTALVVCLRKAAHIYYPDGRTYVVSFPFTLRKAFAFAHGLVLESSGKLVTLVDPIGDFRTVSTPTLVISSNETLVYFENNQCATHHDGKVTLYNIRWPRQYDDLEIILGKRTSTLLEVRIPEEPKKKDMVLTKVDVVEGSPKVVGLNGSIAVVNPGSTTVYPQMTKIVCDDCIAFHGDLTTYLVVLREGKLQLVNPELQVTLPLINVKAERLVGSCENTVAYVSEGELRQVTLVVLPANETIRRCLKAFTYLAGGNISDTIAMMWRTAASTKDEWSAFADTILLVVPGENAAISLGDLLPYVTVALHLIREDTRLDVTNTLTEKLGALLAQLTGFMGWPSAWTKYYHQPVLPTKCLSSVIVESPPNIFASLIDAPYLTFAQLSEESDAVNSEITPRTTWMLRLFDNLNANANVIVETMVDLGITRGHLETLPPGVAFPLKQALQVCQELPAFEWTNPALQLIGRKDIMGLLSLNPQSKPTYAKQGDSAWDGQAEADRMGITKLIFDYDRRYFEITLLLHQTKTQTAHLDPEDRTEYDLVVMQRRLARVVALRILTIPVGRAALFYSGRTPLLTEKFPIAKFNLNTLVTPSMTNIVLGDEDVPAALAEWGHFHNGVLAGLSISTESKGINGSWIIYNKPPELNAQHAGFLLGLGLNGHLRRLEEWHIYNYLGPKHPLTSVGLLLGMAASLRGTMDNKLTKVLSVHALALLPRGANDLNVPVNVQLAGLIGIGLLYLETQHRRMSEILLAQITGFVNQNDQETIHEGYRLSAGIALGLINLGQGFDVDRLLGLATLMKDFQLADELIKLSAGAIIALAFSHLQTNNAAVAAKLEVPLVFLMDYIRPDLLLLRRMAKHLIMWDSIGVLVAWVEAQLPTASSKLDSDNLAYYNLVGGTCMAIAIRYALSHNKAAQQTLIHYFDAMMAITASTPVNYDQRIAFNGALSIQVTLGVCLAVVMAGSGDLETFRRLRAMYHHTSDMSYEVYLGVNFALGMLFLGGGQFAFTTRRLSVAALVTLMIPCRDFEALRYMWALAVEPRCLVVRDVDTQKPVKIAVDVVTKRGESYRVVLPCLVPDFSTLHSLSTNLSDYFRVEVDFSLQLAYLDRFKQTKTLYVSQRRNHLQLQPLVTALLSVANKMLQLANGEIVLPSDWRARLQLEILAPLDSFTKEVLMFDEGDHLGLWELVDDKIELWHHAKNPTIDELWDLKLLFTYGDRHISKEFVHLLHRVISQLGNGSG